MKIDILTNFAKLTEKHKCQSLFFNKVADLKPQACNVIKRETLAHVLSGEFCEIFENTSERLLVKHMSVPSEYHMNVLCIFNFSRLSIHKCYPKFRRTLVEDLIDPELNVPK